MMPAAAEVERFARDLAALSPPADKLGLAVSGGPDSVALLLLAAAARTDAIEAATVDHGLRDGSAAEAAMVAELCVRLGIPHCTLKIVWEAPPTAGVQARARERRYAALADWAEERGLAAIATAHHADDQAETLLMRLGRGAGVSGLAGIRARRPAGNERLLLRPLLAWRRAELRAIVAAAGIDPVDDPANRDPRHERTRARAFLTQGEWLDAAQLAASANHIADAEQALQFTAAVLLADRIAAVDAGLIVQPQGLPRELQRRLLLAAFARLGEPAPRGPDLERAIAALGYGKSRTLGKLALRSIGGDWHVTAAPPRRG